MLNLFKDIYYNYIVMCIFVFCILIHVESYLKVYEVNPTL